MKTERELFEEWFESSQINCKISDLDLTNHDNYWGNALEFSWEAWQAATKREGFKFVPEYHQNNIRDALIIACDIKEDEQRFEDSLNYVGSLH